MLIYLSRLISGTSHLFFPNIMFTYFQNPFVSHVRNIYEPVTFSHKLSINRIRLPVVSAAQRSGTCRIPVENRSPASQSRHEREEAYRLVAKTYE